MAALPRLWNVLRNVTAFRAVVVLLYPTLMYTTLRVGAVF